MKLFKLVQPICRYHFTFVENDMNFVVSTYEPGRKDQLVKAINFGQLALKHFIYELNPQTTSHTKKRYDEFKGQAEIFVCLPLALSQQIRQCFWGGDGGGNGCLWLGKTLK